MDKKFYGQFAFTFAAVLIFSLIAIRFIVKHDRDPRSLFHFGSSLSGERVKTSVPELADITANDLGYDGQFGYLVARDPFARELSRSLFDAPNYRYQRWFLPYAASFVSWGNRDFIPLAFLTLNLFALGLLAYLSSVRRNLSPLLIPSLVIALIFNLNEIWAILFCYLAYDSLKRESNNRFALFSALAIFSHEISIFFLFSLVCSEYWVSRKFNFSYLAPAFAFVMNQFWIMSLFGQAPIFSGSGRFSFPGLGYVAAFGRIRETLQNGSSLFFAGFSFACAATILLLACFGVYTLVKTKTRNFETWFLGISSLLVLPLGSAVLEYPASSLRATFPLFLTYAIVHVPSRNSVRMIFGFFSALCCLWLLR